jgi:hypothetical protein
MTPPAIALCTIALLAGLAWLVFEFVTAPLDDEAD